jgi:hypothetical protein
MIKPEKSLNEEERLNLLESYAICDTLPEEEYDNLTMIASQCNTPSLLLVLSTLKDNGLNPDGFYDGTRS